MGNNFGAHAGTRAEIKRKDRDLIGKDELEKVEKERRRRNSERRAQELKPKSETEKKKKEAAASAAAKKNKMKIKEPDPLPVPELLRDTTKQQRNKNAIQIQKIFRRILAQNKATAKGNEKDPYDFANPNATPPELKQNIQQLLSDTSTGNKKKEINMDSMMALIPLLIMHNTGILGSQDIEELNNQVDKEQPQAEEAIEKMENLMTKLKDLKEIVAKENDELKKNKKKGCNCKKSEKAVKELEDAIDVVDVTDALKICQGKLKKYRHYLINLNNYSATLQKLARDLNTKLEHTIRKTKSCQSSRKKKSTPIPKKKNKNNEKRKNNPKKSKSKD